MVVPGSTLADIIEAPWNKVEVHMGPQETSNL